MNRLYFFLFFILSCGVPVSQKPSLEIIPPWSIIEQFDLNTLKKDFILNQFGRPFDILQDKMNPKIDFYVYHNLSQHTQEWAFGFDPEGILKILTYLPSSSTAKDFSLDEIKMRWEKFKCVHKEKQILKPGLIKEISYLSCEDGKRYVEFNNYNEVISITLKR